MKKNDTVAMISALGHFLWFDWHWRNKFIFIYQANIKKKLLRFTFFKTLRRELVEEHVKYRITIPAVWIDVKSLIRKYFNVQPPQKSRVKVNGKCSFCERTRDRKTTKVIYDVYKSIKFICRNHLIRMYPDCYWGE